MISFGNQTSSANKAFKSEWVTMRQNNNNNTAYNCQLYLSRRGSVSAPPTPTGVMESPSTPTTRFTNLKSIKKIPSYESISLHKEIAFGTLHNHDRHAYI